VRRGGIGRAAWVVLALLAGGCAASTPAMRPDVLVPLGPSLQVLSSVPEDDIGIDMKRHGDAGLTEGGNVAFGVLEEASRGMILSSPDDRVAPLRRAALGVPFRELFWSALDAALAADPVIGRGPPDHYPGPMPDVVLAMAEPPFLVLVTHYLLFDHSHMLAIRTEATLYTGADRHPDYRGVYTYFSGPPGSTPKEEEVWGWRPDDRLFPDRPPEKATPDDWLKAWAANGAEAYRAALEEGIAQTMLMLRVGLAGQKPRVDPEPPEAPKKPERILFNRPAAPGYYPHKSANVLAEDKKRLIVDADYGKLYSIPAGLVFQRNY
jgi:hypothetical protein